MTEENINVTVSEEEAINVTVSDNQDITVVVAGGIGGDEKLKISANDSTSGYLDGKLVAGTGIAFSVGNEGLDETLTINSTGEANTFVGGNGIDITESPDDTLTFVVNQGEISHTQIADKGTNTHPQIDSHIANVTTNPHVVTKTNVGLPNVDNTSDVNKPVSTAQQTALDLKVDENANITGATKTKITYDVKGLVTSGADATTADIADSTDKRYVTDAESTVIDNTSNTNSGDQDLSPYELLSNKSTTVTLGTSDTLYPSQKAVKTYVDTQLTAEDLDFSGDSGTGSIDLDSQVLAISGTTNEVETSASGQALTIGIPTSAQLSIAKLVNLTGNGFVVTSGSDGTLGTDTNTYLTTTDAATTYVSYIGANQNMDIGVYDFAATDGDFSGDLTSIVVNSKLNSIDNHNGGNSFQNDSGNRVWDRSFGYGTWQSAATIDGYTPGANGVFSSWGDMWLQYYSEGKLWFGKLPNTWVDCGTGEMSIDGELMLLDKIKFTQTDGNEYIDSLNDGYLDVGATTGIRLLNDTVVTGFVDASTGFKDNGTAGIDTTFVDADGNTITVSGGIIVSKVAP